MTAESLQMLMEERQFVLADGATGTNIKLLAEKEELKLPPAMEILNIERPELVCDHYRAYISAGSDILLTNSWAANEYKLKDAGVRMDPSEIRELNRKAAQLLKQETSTAGRKLVCAGVVGPTGWIVTDPDDQNPARVDLGELEYSQAVSSFADQIFGLLEGEVDAIWIESQINPHEVLAAIDAWKTSTSKVGRKVPFVVSMVFGRNEVTQASYDLAHYSEEFGQGDNLPVAFGMNCGFGPEVALELVARNKSLWHGKPPLLLKANCGSPRFENNEFVPLGLSPKQMGCFAKLALDLGVKIVGGCCGSLPVHIEAMRVALDNYEPGPPVPPSKIHDIIENAR